MIEIEARLVRVGSRSREMDFEVRVVGRGAPERSESAADLLDPPVVATTARGVVVVPPAPEIFWTRCQRARPSSSGTTGRRPSAERGSPTSG